MSDFLHACLANFPLTLGALWLLLAPFADRLPENRE